MRLTPNGRLEKGILGHLIRAGEQVVWRDGMVQRLGGAKIKFQIEFELNNSAALLSALRFVSAICRSLNHNRSLNHS
jgi:hypothetical protein